MEIATATKPSFSEEFKRLLPERKVLVAWLVLLIAFVWFHWASVRFLTRTWWNQEDYQHGFFVPIFSLVLLWLRRDMIPSSSARGSWWGLPLFALWAVMRWAAIYFNYDTLPELSLIPFMIAMALFVGGSQGLLWAWPAILFLIFMVPLPAFIQGLASAELQRMATICSCWVIQTFGIPAVAQGNVIQLTEKPLEVARACSGLRMMMLFFAICVAAACLMKKPLWERLLIVASAPPIAVVANVFRIVMTGVIYELVGRWSSTIDVDQVEHIIHDWAGFLMMPVGLALLLAETWLLSKLLVAPPPDRPLMVGDLLTRQPAKLAAEAGVRGRNT
jgi:exosortase